MSRFQWPFQEMILASAQSFFIRRNEAVLREKDNEAVEAALASTDLQTLLDSCAPFAGFASSDEYYKVHNPVRAVEDITTPTLLVNAEDDPCCVVQNVLEVNPYSEEGKRYTDQVEQSSCGILALVPSGSHCPFLDGVVWPFRFVPWRCGGIILNNWADETAIAWFEHAVRRSQLGGH